MSAHHHRPARHPALTRLVLTLLAWVGLCSGCGTPEGVAIDRLEHDGQTLHVPGTIDPSRLEEDQPYRLTARVSLPPAMRGQPLDLSLPLFEAQVRVRADQQLVTTDPYTGYRDAGPRRWTIPASATEDGRVDLELTVDHTWTKSGWLNTVPMLLPAGTPDPRADRVRIFNVYGGWLAVGVLVQVGLACLLIFFLDRRRRPYLWFGIQAITAMAYPAFTSGMSVSVWGRGDLTLMSLGLVFALSSSLRFTHSFYGLGSVPRGLWVLLGGAGLLSVVILDPYTISSTTARVVAIAVTVSIIYQLALLGWLLVQRPEQRVSIALLGCGWGALAGGTWGDLIHWLFEVEVLGGVRPACVGLAVFGLCLSLVLSRSHIVLLTEADGLNAALAERVKEAQAQRLKADALNEELRRQIEDRASQLFSALALLESHEGGVGSLLSGTEVDGRYRIERVLGSGAMGMVYLATSLADGSRWAMKVATELRGVALARLAREAHVASRVRHDNVVQIRDIDVASSGFMYIVLELVEGETLREHLQGEGPMPLPEALPVLEQIARGLAALHAAKVAHRDLKPDNVLLTERRGRRVVKIADFGISRVSELADVPRPRGPQVTRPRPMAERPPTITGELEVPVHGPAPQVEPRAAALPVAAATPAASEVSPNPAGSTTPASSVSEISAAPASSGEEETAELPAGELLRDLSVHHAMGPMGYDSADGSGLEDLLPSMTTTGTPSSQELTGTGMLAGTPHYVAPELVLGGDRSSPAADLYSFGVVAYEVLTGERPFPEAVAARLLSRRGLDGLAPPTLPEHCGAVAEVVLRCLSFDPYERPTAWELVERLAQLRAEGQPAAAQPSGAA